MTDCIEQAFRVELRYPVYFTEGMFAPEQPLLAGLVGRRRVLFVIDGGVVRRHPHLLIEIARYCDAHALNCDAQASLVLEDDTVQRGQVAGSVHAALHADRMSSSAIVVGGRTLLGCAGWAVANTGGARLVRVPATAVAQCDDALGLRNRADALDGPWIAYAPPHAVINDSVFLRSLSCRAWSAGCLQVFETALLHDRALFEFIESAAPRLRERDAACMRTAIQRSAALRLRGIAGDPYDQTAPGIDLDQWAAGIAEQTTGHGLRHGEGRVHGLALAATYSYAAGLLEEAAWRRILSTMARLGFAPLAALSRRSTWYAPPAPAFTDDGLRALTVPVAIGRHRRLPWDAALWMRACRILVNADYTYAAPVRDITRRYGIRRPAL